CDDCPWAQEVKKQRLRGKCPPDPEPEVTAPADGGVPGSTRRAEVSWIGVPGTAADDVVTAVSAEPRRTVAGRSVVVVVVAILDPLPNVAGHVVEAKRIGLKRPDW